MALVRRRGKRWRASQSVIDRTGLILLTSRFLFMDGFSEGLAPAWSETVFGYIDLTGKWAIEPQFDQCMPFQNGLAEVQRGDWYGLIDTAGKFIWGPTTEGSVAREFKLDWY
jgi:hypothetical protein